MNSAFQDQLQYTTAANPVSIAGKRVAEYPRSLENIALDAVEELDGFTLVPWVKNGVNRFALRRPNGTVLTPMSYESEREASRLTGIFQPTISYNRGQQRPGSPSVFTTTRNGITFAATTPFSAAEESEPP